MKYQALLPSLFLGLLLVLASCQSKPTRPTLTLRLSPADSTDTLAKLVYWGAEQWREDSLHIGTEDSIVLRPDTTGITHLMVTHAGGEVGLLYRLVGDHWVDTIPSAPKSNTYSGRVLPIEGKDTQGKQRNIFELIKKQNLIVTFSDLSLQTHTRRQRDSLRNAYGKDRAQFVYLMLTPSDSTATNRIKRDSLSKGSIIYSDTLGTVSQMRERYGIGRTTGVYTIAVDSLGNISKVDL